MGQLEVKNSNLSQQTVTSDITQPIDNKYVICYHSLLVNYLCRLENRCALMRTVGSNPTPSATVEGSF